MRYKYINIFAALFLVAGMSVQFVMSYRQARHHVQETIDLKNQIAHEKILFELYDAYEVIDQLKQSVAENLSQPDNLQKETSNLLKRYPSFFCLHVDFTEDYYPEKGKWYSMFSYRLNDSISTINTKGSQFDYSQREWYNGALKSGGKGYWGKTYWSDIINNTIFTYSDDIIDSLGNPFCVVGIDFSLSWMHQLLEQFKPIDQAVCMIYSSDGTVLTASENQSGSSSLDLSEDKWILSCQTFDEIDMEMVIAVPKQLIWKDILWIILFPLVVFVLGSIIVGILIHRMSRDQQENARLETEKKVISRELQIAHDIQMGILRNDFPQDQDVVVHADLLPMREVGGDLYDFARQGDILWFIIGDVSGKGVPATMFMSSTINLFRSALGHQTSPKAIVEEMNAVLSDNNPSLTFVTAFIGRLHIPSGQLTYCNAAHMPPLVLNSDHSVRCIKMIPNVPLGYDEKYKFAQEGCMLGKDQKLVLYTDGVTEARNATRKMMGGEQWMEIARHNDDLLGAVREYIGQAEPTDDITLMTICKTSEVQPVSLHVANHIDQWPLLRSTLHDYGVCIGIEKSALKKLEVALEEAVVNIVSYSQATEIELTIQQNARTLIVRLTDDGVPFDPTSLETDSAKAISELQIGGMGISLLRRIVDELHYQRANERNQLTLIKYL